MDKSNQTGPCNPWKALLASLLAVLTLAACSAASDLPDTAPVETQVQTGTAQTQQPPETRMEEVTASVPEQTFATAASVPSATQAQLPAAGMTAPLGASTSLPAGSTEATATKADPEAVRRMAGYYKLRSVTENGQAVEGNDLLAVLDAYNIRIFLVLEEDGGGFLHSFGEELELDWTPDAITSSGTAMPFELEDDILRLEEGGTLLEFEKSDETPPARGEADAPFHSGSETPSLAREEELSFAGRGLADTPDLRVTAIGLDPYAAAGYTLDLLLENRSERTLVFEADRAAVNRVACDLVFSESLAPGARLRTGISFDVSGLMRQGVGDPAVIELPLRVYPEGENEAIFDETLSVYPMGEDNAAAYQREFSDTDRILWENEDALVVVTGFDPDNFWGFGMELYLENRTDRTLTFSLSDVYLNEAEADPLFDVRLEAGWKDFTEAAWSQEQLEALDGAPVEHISFRLRAVDADDWYASPLVDSTFSLPTDQTETLGLDP